MASLTSIKNRSSTRDANHKPEDLFNSFSSYFLLQKIKLNYNEQKSHTNVGRTVVLINEEATIIFKFEKYNQIGIIY